MNLYTQFNTHWQKQFPNWNVGNCHLLLAVSGGIDSVVLADLIAYKGFSFNIAHCNFQLRGSDSDRDEIFVSSIKGANEIFVKKFDTTAYADSQKIAIQEAARNLRYNWFAELLKDLQTKFDAANNYKQILLVTAHHADDNIETVLMNFFRGTGILGMRGILPYQKEKSLIRPLLPFRKAQIINYAKEKALEFVEDVSNESDKYTRNFFRNQLIPQIQSVFPRVEENILENIERMREVATIYNDSITNQINDLIVQSGTEIHIPILKLKKQNTLATILWEISKTFGFNAAQIAEVIKLMDADNGAFVSSDTHRFIKNRKWLIIAKIENKDTQFHVIEENINLLHFSQGSMHVSLLDKEANTINPSPLFALLNFSKIQFPLLMRKPRTGDYFYPLGMQKKKKISRFFIDQKLSKTQKENCWVIESNKKIVWVIGYRIDDRFKLEVDSAKVLQLQFVPKKS